MTFAVLTALSVLPIAVLLTATTLLPGMLLVTVAQLLSAPFRRLDELLRMPTIRIAAILMATAAIQVGARNLIPGRPSPPLLVIPLMTWRLRPFCSSPVGTLDRWVAAWRRPGSSSSAP